MEQELQRSRSYSYGNRELMQLESYHGEAARPNDDYDLRSYSASYGQRGPTPTQLKSWKGKSVSAASVVTRSWSLSDPELQRKARVASYKMYSAEGKLKGSFRKSFRWLKNKYSRVVYGWY